MARMYPERPVVILTELDNINEDFSNVEELLYVGVSRATAHLIAGNIRWAISPQLS